MGELELVQTFLDIKRHFDGSEEKVIGDRREKSVDVFVYNKKKSMMSVQLSSSPIFCARGEQQCQTMAMQRSGLFYLFHLSKTFKTMGDVLFLLLIHPNHVNCIPSCIYACTNAPVCMYVCMYVST